MFPLYLYKSLYILWPPQVAICLYIGISVQWQCEVQGLILTFVQALARNLVAGECQGLQQEEHISYINPGWHCVRIPYSKPPAFSR